VDKDLPVGRSFLGKQHLQESALPGPTGAGDKDEITFGDMKVQVLQGRDILLVPLADVKELDHGFGIGSWLVMVGNVISFTVLALLVMELETIHQIKVCSILTMSSTCPVWGARIEKQPHLGKVPGSSAKGCMFDP
jgi:hypothetical protein